jgi:hypothetical protein
MNAAKNYEDQCRIMARVVHDWRAAKKSAVIQFNFPRSVAVIATIGDALENHFVTADAGGLELLKLLGLGEPIEPTVLMVRAVIELSGGE